MKVIEEPVPLSKQESSEKDKAYVDDLVLSSKSPSKSTQSWSKMKKYSAAITQKKQEQ